jgi:hypothetical protein
VPWQLKSLPTARRDLLTTALDEEVVVYDPQRKRAYSLSRIAVAVWNHCDGRKTVADLQQLAAAEYGLLVDEGHIWLALRRLESANLLASDVARLPRVSRRQVLQRAGRIGIGAVATPIIASVVVPVAAAAASQPPPLPVCKPTHGGDIGCSSIDESCVCLKTTSGVTMCINPSTALKKTTCKTDSDCKPGYFCIPRGKAPPRCIRPCAVATCRC